MKLFNCQIFATGWSVSAFWAFRLEGLKLSADQRETIERLRHYPLQNFLPADLTNKKVDTNEIQINLKTSTRNKRQNGREISGESFWNDIRLTHQQRLLFEREFSNVKRF